MGKTAEERVEQLFDICAQIKEVDEVWFRKQLLLQIKEAMRDQRHACAESLLEVENLRGASEPPVVYRHEAYQAVMNAEVKPVNSDERAEKHA